MATSINGSDNVKHQAIAAGLGVLCILFSYCILTWNEHRVGQVVVDRTTASTKGSGPHAAKEATSDDSSGFSQSPGANAKSITSSPIDPENNGRVVFLSGVPKTSDTLSDTGFAVERVGLRLKRQVYMFQWQQVTTPDAETGVAKIAFQKVWSRELIDDKKFDFQSESSPYRNPKKIAVEETELAAKVVILGDFKLSPELIKAIPYNDTVDLSTVDTVKVRNRFSQPVQVKHDGKMLYIGNDPDKPEVGDLRIEIVASQPQLISLAAFQNNGTLDPIDGKHIVLQPGQLTLEQLLSKKAATSDAAQSAKTPAAKPAVDAPSQDAQVPAADAKPDADAVKLAPSPAAVPQQVYLASWTFRIIGTGAMVAGFILLGFALQSRITMLQGTQGYVILSVSAVIVSLLLMAFFGFVYHRLLSMLMVLLAGGLGYILFTQLCATKPPSTPT